MLELQNISYQVDEEGKDKEIIKDISLKIDGRFTAITGPNGGGKSTLLRIMSGVFDPDKGEVNINGINILDNPSVKGECFFIPDYPYFSNSSTLENTAFLFRSLYPNWNENAFKQFCSVFPIDPDARIIDMSKGMQRQAALILALSTCPRYLLLDEIFDGLDPVVRDEMLDTFLDFVQEEDHSILLSSHITSDLEKVADYITFIHNGKLIMTVSKNDLVYNYAVMRCKESQFLTLDPKDILAYRKRDFQIDVLVSDCKAMQRKYKEIVIDHVSVDEFFLLLVRGDHV